MSKIAKKLIGPAVALSTLFNAGAAFAYDTTTLETAKLPKSNVIEGFLSSFEHKGTDFDASSLRMQVVTPNQSKPNLICMDNNKDGKIDIEEKFSEKGAMLQFHSTLTGTVEWTPVKNSNQVYKIAKDKEIGMTWGVIWENIDTVSAVIAKDGNNILVNKQIPSFGQASEYVLGKDGKPVVEKRSADGDFNIYKKQPVPTYSPCPGGGRY
ncbi:MAG: hypothetical protein COB76_05845 [Alphaproteobacteria bacterium]|nr:MAG: hypothetical protein COB76_05845 [Alphaproteobacteria bacterium]